jgi:thiamine pyrophosphate-dependent acetolactate synthase large subunit-like protein
MTSKTTDEIATMLTSNQGSPTQSKTMTAASVLVTALFELGVTKAFGVSGGAMAPLWHSLSISPIDVIHCRQETGAVFAAIEYHFASGEPVAVFTTTGPGLTNALTGVLAAHDEGAKIVLVSAFSSAPKRGRWLIQETTVSTLPADLYRSGSLFHFASIIEEPVQLSQTRIQLAAGLARPGGFVAHIAMPTSIQSAPTTKMSHLQFQPPILELSAVIVERYVALLLNDSVVIWVGFGARHAAGKVRELAKRLQARVICSPRGKGIFPEDDPLFIGVTGIGGHETAAVAIAQLAPKHILVLGSRLGEASSFYDPRLTPNISFIHVDIDPTVPGVSYPDVMTVSVCAEIGSFLTAVLSHIPDRPSNRKPSNGSLSLVQAENSTASALDDSYRVRPQYLMQVIQNKIVDRSEATLLADSGNSFIWTTHYLKFVAPQRYRVSTGVGSMGHAAAGVLGAALALKGKAVAVLGDGAMLMTNEINTAVHCGAQAVWIVLNDGRYNMCAQGMETLGLTADATIPEVDFASFATAQGAMGIRVENELHLEAALDQAMSTTRPCVLDVLIDPAYRPPSDNRNSGLKSQMVFPNKLT